MRMMMMMNNCCLPRTGDRDSQPADANLRNCQSQLVWLKRSQSVQSVKPKWCGGEGRLGNILLKLLALQSASYYSLLARGQQNTRGQSAWSYHIYKVLLHLTTTIAIYRNSWHYPQRKQTGSVLAELKTFFYWIPTRRRCKSHCFEWFATSICPNF